MLFTYHFVFNSNIPLQPLISMAKSPGAGYQTNQVNEAKSRNLLSF